MFKRLLKVSVLLLCMLMCKEGTILAQSTDSLQTFVMGEDVLLNNGLIICVNAIERKQAQSGLGMRRTDEVFINLTLVNNGYKTLNINPQENFTLEIGPKTMHSEVNEELSAYNQPFKIFQSSQTRLNLFYKVSSNLTGTPKLVLNIDGEGLQILCDPSLQSMQQASKTAQLSVNEALELGEVLINANRLDEAENLIRPMYERYSNDYRFLFLMASIAQQRSDMRGAELYLEGLDASTIKNPDDAVKFAKMAMKMGFYEKVIALLEPHEITYSLNDEARRELAQAYYYTGDYISSAGILEPLINNESQDASVYFIYGNMLEKQNKIEKAVEYWQKTLQLDQSYIEARFNLGVGYMKLDRLQDARGEWQEVLRQEPDKDIAQAAKRALEATE